MLLAGLIESKITVVGSLLADRVFANARCFSALQNVVIGPKRHFAAARQFGCFRTDADIGLDFMNVPIASRVA